MATVKESLTVPPVVNGITDWEADVLAHTSRNGRYMTDSPRVIALAARGLLRDYGAQRLAGGMHYLTLTDKGSEALREWRSRQPVVKVKPRRQSREFEAWREYREVWSDITFSEFHTRIWPELRWKV